MALTQPTTDDFWSFWGDEADVEDDARATIMLELATNLMWMATQLEDDPTDSRLASMVKFGIIDMAIYLYVSRDDIDAQYSPLNSERVGSYSYTKDYIRAVRNVGQGKETGAALFDKVVEYYNDQIMGDWLVSGEKLTHGHFHQLWEEQWLADPSIAFFSYAGRNWSGWPYRAD